VNSEQTIQTSHLVATIKQHFPKVQGIYLFGSFATATAHRNSDVDIGLLLPHQIAKKNGSLALSKPHMALEKQLNRPVDLINLRLVSTVLQHQVITTGRLLDNANPYAIAEFEMLTLSFYVKLNEEREEILREFWKTSRAYQI
jgi:predicted nucleotidyltransferase